MSNPHNAIPHRFKESQFKRFENELALIVEQFPKPTIFRPVIEGKPVSIETFSNRLRDAKTSLRQNQWPTRIDMARFLQCVDEIVISQTPEGQVVVGNRETVRSKTPLGQPWSQEPPATAGRNLQWRVNIVDSIQLKVLVDLFAQRTNPQGLELTLVGITQEQATQYERHNDVAFLANEDGSFTLI